MRPLFSNGEVSLAILIGLSRDYIQNDRQDVAAFYKKRAAIRTIIIIFKKGGKRYAPFIFERRSN